jgi:predicted metal-dependent hydrolase
MPRKFFKPLRKKGPKRQTLQLSHDYEGIRVPIRVYFEVRSNVRISIGQENAILRIPLGLRESAIQKHLSWAHQWMDEQLRNQPNLLQRFQVKNYKSGQYFRINGEAFVLLLKKEDRKSIGIRLNGHEISLALPISQDKVQDNKNIKRALSRFFARYYKNQVESRIRELNDRYFGEHIESVRIKYNKSNWGSCSAKKNINISSRLLFAPPSVQDYVFVHELTHLKELNHSSRFWKIVGEIVPDYKQKEKWLKENSHRLDF